MIRGSRKSLLSGFCTQTLWQRRRSLLTVSFNAILAFLQGEGKEGALAEGTASSQLLRHPLIPILAAPFGPDPIAPVLGSSASVTQKQTQGSQNLPLKSRQSWGNEHGSRETAQPAFTARGEQSDEGREARSLPRSPGSGTATEQGQAQAGTCQGPRPQNMALRLRGPRNSSERGKLPVKDQPDGAVRENILNQQEKQPTR